MSGKKCCHCGFDSEAQEQRLADLKEEIYSVVRDWIQGPKLVPKNPNCRRCGGTGVVTMQDMYEAQCINNSMFRPPNTFSRQQCPSCRGRGR